MFLLPPVHQEYFKAVEKAFSGWKTVCDTARQQAAPGEWNNPGFVVAFRYDARVPVMAQTEKLEPLMYDLLPEDPRALMQHFDEYRQAPVLNLLLCFPCTVSCVHRVGQQDGSIAHRCGNLECKQGSYSATWQTYLLCARCKCVHYCSKECQKLAWEQGHRDRCRGLEAGYNLAKQNSELVGPLPHVLNADGSRFRRPQLTGDECVDALVD